MNTYELFLCLLFPARRSNPVVAKMDRRVKAAEESMPWWAYRRADHDSVEKTLDVQSLNVLTSSVKKIG